MFRFFQLSIVLWTLFFWAPVYSQEVDDSYELLWKIEGNNLSKPSYLFGTMHLRNNKVFDFSDSVLLKLHSADVFAAEINLDSSLWQSINNSIRQAENDFFIGDEFSDEELELFDEKGSKFGFGKNKISRKSIKELKRMLDYFDDPSEDLMPTQLDTYLYQFAKNSGLSTMGLEPLSSRDIAMDTISLEERKEIVSEKFEHLDQLSQRTKEMVNLYHKGNLTEIWNYIDAASKFNRKLLLDDRNIAMIGVFEPIMQDASMFIAVGVAHLPGEMGIINLLRKKGYKVEVVKSPRSQLSKDILETAFEEHWHTEVDSIGGIMLDVPYAINSFEMFGGLINMRASYNLIQENIYAYFSVSAAMQGDDQEAMLDRIENSISRRSNDKIIKKEIEHNGVKGYELKYKNLDSNTIRLFSVQGQVHLLLFFGIQEYIDESNKEQFFNSVKFFEPSKKINNWVSYPNQLGAYTVQFPLEPKYMIQQIEYSYDDDDTYPYHVYMCLNEEQRELYMLVWNDLPKGYYFDDDSAFFQSRFGDVIGEEYEFNPSEEKQLNDIGFVGYELAESFFIEGYNVRLKSVLRGSRNYLLMAQSLNDINTPSADQFLNSFEMTPVKQPVFQEFSIDSFSIKLPEIPTFSEEEKDYYSDLYYRAADVVEENSGVNISVRNYRLPRYFQLPNIDSLYALINDQHIIFEDQDFEITQDLNENGLFTRSGLITGPLSHTKIRFKYIVNGDQIWTVHVHQTDEYLGQGVFDVVLDSAILEPYKTNFDPFQDKRNQLFHDLKSSDTTILAEAMDGIEYLEFDSTHINRLFQSIHIMYPDSNDYYSTKEIILNKLSELEPPGFTDSLKAYFDEYSSLRGEIVSSLLEENESPENVLNMVYEIPLEDLGYSERYQLINKLSDSTDLFVRNADKLMDLMERNDGFRSSVLYSEGFIKHRNELKEEHYTRLEMLTNKWFKASFDSVMILPEDSSSYWEHSSNVENAIKIFSIIPSRHAENLIKKVRKSKEDDIQAAILYYKMSNNQSYSQKQLQKILKTIYTGWYFVEDLNERGILDKVLGTHLTKEQVYKMAIVYYLSDDYDISREMDWVGSDVIVSGEERMEVDFFEYSYEGEEEKYLAMVGKFEWNGTSFSDENIYVDYDWNEITSPENQKESMKSLIEYAQEYGF